MRFAPLVLLLAANVAVGQPPEKGETPKAPAAKAPADKVTDWKGRIVMGKSGHVPLRQPTTLPDGTPGYTVFVGVDYSYFVHEEQGDLLLLRTRAGKEGWAEKDGMVPVKDAVAYFTKALEDMPVAAVECYRLRGIANNLNGKHDAAIEDVTEAIRLDPTDWAQFSQRSNYWAAKKNYDKAIEDLDEGLRLKPGHVSLLASRAFVRAKKGDYAAAANEYE